MDAVDTRAGVGANGEGNESDASVNAKLKERLARKDWYKDTQSPYYEVRVSLRNARIKNHYVRYFDATQLNIHLIENAPALLKTNVIKLEHVLSIISDVEAKLAGAAKEFEQEIAVGEALATSEGVRLELKYFQDPLELDVRILSPLCYQYLDVIQKADRFLMVASCLQLRGKITFESFNKKCERVYEVLNSIQRGAFQFQAGLRTQASKVKAASGGKWIEDGAGVEQGGGETLVSPPPKAKLKRPPKRSTAPREALATG